MNGSGSTGRAPWLAATAAGVGVVLLVIGIRFWVVPQQAATFFGLTRPPGPFDLHRVVALRDLWLALMLIALAALAEWRALALCLGLGSLVCLGDAVIVTGSSAHPLALGFHIGSGVVCCALAVAAWRQR